MLLFLGGSVFWTSLTARHYFNTNVFVTNYRCTIDLIYLCTSVHTTINRNWLGYGFQKRYGMQSMVLNLKTTTTRRLNINNSPGGLFYGYFLFLTLHLFTFQFNLFPITLFAKTSVSVCRLGHVYDYR